MYFLVVEAKRKFPEAGTLIMQHHTSAAPVLSFLVGKPILVTFDGVEISSDAGLTLLR